jgi:hypothetical protein
MTFVVGGTTSPRPEAGPAGGGRAQVGRARDVLGHLALFVGLAGLVTGVALLYISVDHLLASGVSSCASGPQPYVVANPCPDDVARASLLIPAAIVGGLVFAGIYAVGVSRVGGVSPWLVGWSGLFGSLAVPFWRYGLDFGSSGQANVGLLVVAPIFAAMGFGPLLYGGINREALFYAPAPASRPATSGASATPSGGPGSAGPAWPTGPAPGPRVPGRIGPRPGGILDPRRTPADPRPPATRP